MEIRSKLREILKKRGITGNAFANFIGIPQPQLHKYLTGQIPGTMNQYRIADALDLTPGDIWEPVREVEKPMIAT